MFKANVWVRGPHDLNWRLNATFTRSNCHDAVDRASDEIRWYESRGYRTFVGPEAPELDVPLLPEEIGSGVREAAHHIAQEVANRDTNVVQASSVSGSDTFERGRRLGRVEAVLELTRKIATHDAYRFGFNQSLVHGWLTEVVNATR